MAKKEEQEDLEKQITKITYDLYGNGSKGIVERMNDEEKKNNIIFKKYDKLDQKINIIILFLIIALGEGLGALEFLGKLFNL